MELIGQTQIYCIVSRIIMTVKITNFNIISGFIVTLRYSPTSLRQRLLVLSKEGVFISTFDPTVDLFV